MTDQTKNSLGVLQKVLDAATAKGVFEQLSAAAFTNDCFIQLQKEIALLEHNNISLIKQLADAKATVTELP